jgi:predicted RNase H-like HicB family nuclease
VSGASAEEETMVSDYSTTVAGTQYSGSVEESGREYTASVPNLAGATATGSSIEAAENNLDNRIDELV